MKTYITYGFAFVIGIGLAWASWLLLVEPNYPYLILDKSAVVIDDQTGIGYLPVEITGLDASKGEIRRMCVVPSVYKNYAHGVSTDDDNLFSPKSFLGKNIALISWIIVGIGAIVLIITYFVVKKRRRAKK